MANIITDGSTFQGAGSVSEDGNSGGTPPSNGQAVPNGAGAPNTPPPGPDNPQAAEALSHVVAQTQPAAPPTAPPSPHAAQTPLPAPAASSGSSFRSPTVTPSFFASGSQGHNQQTGFPGGPYAGGEIGLAEAQYAGRVQQTYRAQAAAQAAQQAIQSGDMAQAAQIMRDNPNVGVTVNGGAAVYGDAAAQVVTQQAGRAVISSQPQVDVSSLGEVPPIPPQRPQVSATLTPLPAANAPGFGQAASAPPPAVDVASLGEAPAAPTLNHQAGSQPASNRAAGNLLSAANIAALGAPPPAPSTSASTLIAGRTGTDHAAQRRAEINQQAANVVDAGAFIREHGLPPLAPGMRPDPAEASLHGVRMIIDTTGINPGGTDLGRAVARQALLQYGLTATEADLYLQYNPETRYRSDHGTGAALSDAELRERVASGRIDNTMTAAFVQRIEQFRSDLARSVSAVQQTDAQRWVGTATNYLDRATGGGESSSGIGAQFNRLGVGGLHLIGEMAAMGAAIRHQVNNAARAILPESVGNLLTEQERRDQQTIDALRGAQSEVTAQDNLLRQQARDAGIGVPLIERVRQQLPEAPADALRGAVYGQYDERNTVGTVIGQTLTGAIPGAAQAADARDLTAAGQAVYQGEDGSWWRLGLTTAAIIPGLDALKLRGALDDAVRAGERAAIDDVIRQSQADAALREAMRSYNELGEVAPRLNLRLHDAQNAAAGAHTIERHGADIPLHQAGAPAGQRTVEGRIYGDAPWSGTSNFSYRWTDEATMNRTVNDYVRRNWDQIRSDLVLNDRPVHEATFDAGRAVGEGFFNSGQMGIGPRQAVYHQTSFVKITIELVPGNPPNFVVIRAYPAGSAQ